MRPGDRAPATSRPNPERFRTPDKPATGRSSTVSDKSKRASIFTRRISNGTSASSNSTFRSSRRDAGPNEQDQPTLTQIDFVTPASQNVPSSDDLDYIEDHGQRNLPGKPCEVIEIDDDSEDDADYKPSNSEKRRSRGVRFETDTESNKKRRQSVSLNRRGRDSERTRRKSDDSIKGKKKGKKTQSKERHKTLTQMDYVRRYVKIEPDDDMEYTYRTPKKMDQQESSKKHTPVAEGAPHSPTLGQESSSEHKRRKLNINPGLSGDLEPAGQQKDEKSTKHPVTPQKPRRSEIPSSQSPESPGLAIISSSQFRSATRSPLKQPPLLAADMPIEEVSTKKEYNGDGDILNAARKSSPFHDSLPPIMPDSPLSQKHALPDRSIIDVFDTQLNPTDEEPLERNALKINEAKPPSTTQRTVIYETDAETDDGDLQDTLSSPLRSPTKQQSVDLGHNDSKETDDLANDDSQYLPPPPVPADEQDTESGLLTSETNLPSDASVYYQRVQPATQFPLEPIPTLNTQKLAELFPNESSHQQTPVKQPRILSDPNNCILSTQTQTQSETQTQTPTQSQTQSQGVDRTPTEIVPESSPISRQEDDTVPNKAVRFKPRLQDSVVQVESSQPADRLPRRISREQDSYQPGMLTEGQILTSSVMESVPMPEFWLGSQDSVGEPYEVPDT